MVAVGTKIKMNDEVQRYTVQAANERFAIMTKPFNARRTYLYTITDLKRGVRGPCNLIFGLPCHVNTRRGALRALVMIVRGDMEVTHRRDKALTPEEIAQLKSEETTA